MPIDSDADTVPEIIDELKETDIAERSTRAQDQESEDAFEKLRAQGYM
jgi:sulfate adenylyltransferase subunit 2